MTDRPQKANRDRLYFVIFGAGAFAFFLLAFTLWYFLFRYFVDPFQFLAALVGLLSFGLTTFQRFRQDERTSERIEKVEIKARENPDKPQFAWDLARTVLEAYLDRNQRQLRSIFWLNLLVMAAGFGVVVFGLMKAFDSNANLPVAIVSSASGIIISFIGGSFLLVYRSILAQTRDYVSVLERINAVGMAVQVLGTITEDGKKLRDESTANLAKQLIELYSKTYALKPSTS